MPGLDLYSFSSEGGNSETREIWPSLPLLASFTTGNPDWMSLSVENEFIALARFDLVCSILSRRSMVSYVYNPPNATVPCSLDDNVPAARREHQKSKKRRPNSPLHE